MKKKIVFGIFVMVFLALFFLPRIVEAAPFLTCDAYPVGSSQPTAFVVMEGTVDGASGTFLVTKTYPDSLAKIDDKGNSTLFFDLGVMTMGLKNIIVKAKNAAGESAASAVFTFTLPVPVIPNAPLGFLIVNPAPSPLLLKGVKVPTTDSKPKPATKPPVAPTSKAK
jgi:hypothetical protein